MTNRGVERDVHSATLVLDDLLAGEQSGEKIQLLVDMTAGLGGDRWPAATGMCKLISANAAFFGKTLFSVDKTVLELGAGTGLGGIYLSRQYRGASPKITITDLPQYLDLIEHNIGANNVRDDCQTAPLDWCDLSSLPRESFDVILALECVYRQDLYAPLIDTFRNTAHGDSVILLGVTRLFAKRVFFKMLLDAGFNYSKVPYNALPASIRSDTSAQDLGLFIVTNTSKNTSKKSV